MINQQMHDITGLQHGYPGFMLFLDGIYVDGASGSSRFRCVKAPTSAELTQLVHTIAQCFRYPGCRPAPA